MSIAISMEDVVFSRGQFSLRLPRWQVEVGQPVALHGPSGCGKSTLLGLIAGALLPTQGRVVVDGQDLATLTRARRRQWRAQRVGVVFQDFPLIDYLTALDNVLLPYRLTTGLRLSPAVRKRAADLLDVLSLPQHHDTRPGALSQGERQRVAIARALVTEPAVLLADEPTAGLDPTQSEAVLSLLWSLAEQRGLALVLVTHDPALLSRFTHRLDVSRCSA